MSNKLFAMTFGNAFSIAYSSYDNNKIEFIQDKNNNKLFNYEVEIDDVVINPYKIINLISEGIKEDSEYIISYTNDYYLIQYKDKKNLKLEDILEKLFIKLKTIVKDSIQNTIKNIILVFQKNISYDITIIMKTIGLLLDINIINILDITSAFKFYLENEKINFPTYFSIIINMNCVLEFSVFKQKRKIFKKSHKLASDEYEKLINNKDEINLKKEFEVLNKKKSENFFNFFFEIIKKKMDDDMGDQDFDIQEIYYTNNLNNEILLKNLCFGAILSDKYPLLSEYQLIIKFLDYNENNNLSTIELSYIEFSISQPEIKLTIEEFIPYKNCFYMAIPLIMREKNAFARKKSIITIYFNQINYFYASANLNDFGSQELIFYQNFPNIKILGCQINYDEKFEENCFFKRINIISITPKDLEIEGLDNKFIQDNVINNDNDELIIFDSNLNIVSAFIKKETVNRINNFSDKKIAINSLKISEIINSKLSPEEINKQYDKLLLAVESLKNSFIINSMKTDYDLLVEDDIIFMKLYYKLKLFGCIFYTKKSFDLNQYNLFSTLFQNLEDFENKCKKINNNKLESLLFCSACIALSNIAKDPKKSLEIKAQKELLDLLDFSENTIYKDAIINNMDFIIQLKRSSFIYKYLLQFNSASKLNQNLVYDDGTNEERKLKTTMISMITIHQLKYDLFKSLPQYGIRLFFNYDDDKATTIINTSITMFNEIKLFKKPLTILDLNPDNDTNFIKRVRISITIKHERFCHIKKIFNKNEDNYINSPIVFYNLDSHELIIFHQDEENFKGEIGESFGNLITNNHRELIIELYNIDDIQMKKLYDNSIWVNEANNNLIDELKAITKLETEHEPEYIEVYNYEESEKNIKYFSLSSIYEKKENNKIKDNDYLQKTAKKFKIRHFKQNSIHEDKTLKLTHTFMENKLKRITIKIDKKELSKKIIIRNNKKHYDENKH